MTVVTSLFFLHFCRQQKASSQKTTCQDLSEVKRGGNKKAAAAAVATDLLRRGETSI